MAKIPMYWPARAELAAAAWSAFAAVLRPAKKSMLCCGDKKLAMDARAAVTVPLADLYYLKTCTSRNPRLPSVY